ncbi:MAG: hypothetical protein IPP14_10530 [Planctomycetes bacterium]|nr:hypothetical protein [Planctomycetota bacterium]
MAATEDLIVVPTGLVASKPNRRRLAAAILAFLLLATVIWIAANAGFMLVDMPGRHSAVWEKARSDMGELQKALLHYAQDHSGAFPDTLAEIRPAFGGNLPSDPYTDDDFRYARTPDGFELTCLGRDNAAGGDAAPNADIVFTRQGQQP